MKKINTAIVDDSRVGISNLLYALDCFMEIKVCATALNAQEGRSIILQNKPELLFLDIELPDLSGLDLLRDIRTQISWPMQVVFYTAYDKYLLDAIRESAFDCLLKPFTTEELQKVLSRYFALLGTNSTQPSVNETLSRLFPENTIYLIATVDGFQILRLEQIGFFKYMKHNKHWMVYLTDQRILQLKRNTNARNIIGYSPSFVQINRDQIININYLSMIRGNKCVFFPPFEHIVDLKVTIGFIRLLQERFNQI